MILWKIWRWSLANCTHTISWLCLCVLVFTSLHFILVKQVFLLTLWSEYLIMSHVCMLQENTYHLRQRRLWNIRDSFLTGKHVLNLLFNLKYMGILLDFTAQMCSTFAWALFIMDFSPILVLYWSMFFNTKRKVQITQNVSYIYESMFQVCLNST